MRKYLVAVALRAVLPVCSAASSMPSSKPWVLEVTGPLLAAQERERCHAASSGLPGVVAMLCDVGTTTALRMWGWWLQNEGVLFAQQTFPGAQCFLQSHRIRA